MLDAGGRKGGPGKDWEGELGIGREQKRTGGFVCVGGVVMKRKRPRVKTGPDSHQLSHITYDPFPWEAGSKHGVRILVETFVSNLAFAGQCAICS